MKKKICSQIYQYIWARPARLAWRVLHFFQFQTCIWGNLGCLRLKIWFYCVQGVAMYTWSNFQSISSNSFKLRAQHSCATRVTKSWRDNLHDLIQLGTVAQGKVIGAHGLFYASRKFLAVKISKFYIYLVKNKIFMLDFLKNVARLAWRDSRDILSIPI